MKARLAWVALALAMAFAAQTSAHFPWVVVEKAGGENDGGAGKVNVWFSELAEPDSAELIDRITKMEVWTRSAKTEKQAVQVAKKLLDGGGGALVGTVPAGVSAASGHITYGVLDRGGNRFLLEYHAKCLHAAAADFKAIARDEALLFDIVPQTAGKSINLTVLFGGKPATGAEVVILDPIGGETKATTDEAGQTSLAVSKSGLYSIRAKWVVKEAGKLGDQEYPQVNHYCTLALRVP